MAGLLAWSILAIESRNITGMAWKAFLLLVAPFLVIHDRLDPRDEMLGAINDPVRGKGEERR